MKAAVLKQSDETTPVVPAPATGRSLTPGLQQTFNLETAVADPQPQPKEVVIRLAAASINRLDTLMRQGYGERLFKWLRRAGPIVLGLDGAGVISAVGAQVKDFKVGDRVMAAAMPFRSGFYAEQIALPAAWVAKIPDGIGFETAAALPYAGLTAMQVLKAAGLSPATASGKRVLVHGGAGGIGSLLVQLLHAWGAWVATTCRTANIPLVMDLGADLAVDYTCEDFTRKLSDLDVVVNTVAPTTADIVEAPHFAVLRRGGRYVSLISPTLSLADILGPPLGLLASATWMGVARLRWAMAGKVHRWVYFRPSGRDLSRLGEWVSLGWARPLIGGVYPLAEVARAQHRVETGPVQGKVLLLIDEGLSKTGRLPEVAGTATVGAATHRAA